MKLNRTLINLQRISSSSTSSSSAAASTASTLVNMTRSKCTNNMDSYHHTVGSDLPTLSSRPGAVTLVNMRFCPYAQRTVLCLNAKNVDYDIINSQLMNKVSSREISALAPQNLKCLARLVVAAQPSGQGSSSSSRWKHNIRVTDNL